MRTNIAPALEGRRLEHVEISDIRLTRPEGSADRRFGADRRARRARRPSRQVPDRPFRVGPCAADPPPHDGLAAGRRARGDPHRRALLTLDDGCRSPTAMSGVRHVAAARAGRAEPYLGARLGEEPLVAAFTAKGLGERLEGRRAALKAALLEQRTLAGLGNIYVDEALWYSRLHPQRPAGSLDRDELRRLHRAIRKALELGIARQGSTLTDYRLPDGGSGSMQKEFKAYGRDDEPCDRCGTLLAKIRVAGRARGSARAARRFRRGERGTAAGGPLADRPDRGYLPRPLPFGPRRLVLALWSASRRPSSPCGVLVLHLGGVVGLRTWRRGLALDFLWSCDPSLSWASSGHRARADRVAVAEMRPHRVLADRDRVLALVADRRPSCRTGTGPAVTAFARPADSSECGQRHHRADARTRRRRRCRGTSLNCSTGLLHWSGLGPCA